MSSLPIFAPLKPLEKINTFTPLGIHFWDMSGHVKVTEGLEVVARPPGQPHLTRRAVRTSSGVYAFHYLPGMRDIETSDPDLDAGLHPVSSPPNLARFVIEVNDHLDRFLSVAFQIDLPHRGVYPTQPFGPSALPGFYLFSRSSRPVLSNLAVVRAQLIDRNDAMRPQPASHALLEIETESGDRWSGIADENGSVAIFFPYPPFAVSVGSASPPQDEDRRQAWPLLARVRYRLAAQTKPDAFARQPDLRTLLTQPTARFRLSSTGSPQDHFMKTLRFGQTSILTTAGLSELWIET